MTTTLMRNSVGLAAAAALGESPARVLKTLMTRIDGKPACAILPSDRELVDEEARAGARRQVGADDVASGRERLTGYKVGGISPVRTDEAGAGGAGSRARWPEELVYVNGGQRGLQVRLAPRDIAALLEAVTAEIVA